MSETLEALLQEGRTFPPSDAFRKQALVTATDLYDEAERDWQGFWARPGARARLGAGVDADPRLGSAVREVVRRRPPQRLLQLPRPPRRRGPRRPGRVLLGRRARRHARPHLRRHARGDRPGRQRAQVARCHEGRSRRDLPRHGSRARDHDARVRAHRRRALRRVRRLLVAVAARPHQRRGGEGPRHRRRRVASRLDRRAQGDRRRGRSPRRRCIERVVVLRRTGQDVAIDATRDVWYHDLVPQQPAECRVRVDGLRRPALPALHERHHRQAQGHHAHDRRLPHAGRVHAPLRVRPASRHRRVLVHRRRRLGDRSLVHRLRTAREPRDERDVRRHARPSRPRAAVVDRREVQGDDLLHRADRDPDVHEVGRHRTRVARPLVAAPARHGRRTDQSRSVGLVLAGDRRRSLPGRRHLVADRDRRDHDQRAAGRDDPEARERDVPAARDRGRHRRRRRQAASASPAAATSCSSDRGRRCCAASGATRSATARPTGAPSPAATSRATAPSATTRATSGCSAGSTTSCSSPGTTSRRPRSSRRSSTIRRWPRPRSSGAPTRRAVRRSPRS